MHPKCIVTVNGTPVAGAFWERLLRVTVTDREGSRSDTIDLELEDGVPHLAIPEDGDLIQCWLGYEETGVEYMGSFKVMDVDVTCIPWSMQIRGEAADMNAALKEHDERHWDDATVDDIVGDFAKKAGLTPQVAPAIGQFKFPWFGQLNASGLHTLETLASRLDGVFTVKDGKLLLAERGKGETPGGTALPPLVVTPPMIIKGSCKVSFAKRSRHKSTDAEWYDRDEGERKKETHEGEDKAEAGYTERHAASSPDEAKRLAKSRSKYLKGEGVRTSVDIEGTPTAKAGRPMVYAGVRPGVDGTQFIIEEAAHSFEKGGGYKTSLKGKLRTEGGGGGEGDAAGEDDPGSGAAAP